MNRFSAAALRILETRTFALLCLASFAMLAYANSFHVPWYFDDYRAIFENPKLQNPAAIIGENLLHGRDLAILSFAINYHFGGVDVFGYHVVNFAVHLASAVVVYLLCRRFFPGNALLALAIALTFALHPVQTQAVTYVVQRMTSLSGLLFLLAFYLYLHASNRVEAASLAAGWFYLAAGVAAALAALIKQNAVTFPLLLALYAWCFDNGLSRRHWLRLLPFCLVPLILVGAQVLWPLSEGSSLAELGHTEGLHRTFQVTPLRYFSTELQVLWLYLRLIFLPVGQMLEYGYPIAREVFNPASIAAGLGLAALLYGSYRLRPRTPLVFFGLAWFLLTLAVESTFLPLDPVVEHRLYVPLFGILIATAGLLGLVLQGKRLALPFLFCVLPLMVLTWQRNTLWNNRIAFLEDNFRRAPHSERLANGLAYEYILTGRYPEALATTLTGLRNNPAFPALYDTLATIYFEQRQFDKSLQTAEDGLKFDPNHANLLRLVGKNLLQFDQPASALAAFDRAIQADPNFPKTYLSRGILHATRGDLNRAEADFKTAIALSNSYPQAHYNLALVYRQQGRLLDAEAEQKLAAEQSRSGSSPP